MYSDTDPSCPWCKSLPADYIHMLWLCPALCFALLFGQTFSFSNFSATTLVECLFIATYDFESWTVHLPLHALRCASVHFSCSSCFCWKLECCPDVMFSLFNKSFELCVKNQWKHLLLETPARVTSYDILKKKKEWNSILKNVRFFIDLCCSLTLFWIVIFDLSFFFFESLTVSSSSNLTIWP